MLISRKISEAALRSLAGKVSADTTLNRYYSKDYSTSDDEKESKKKKPKPAKTAEQKQERSGADESATTRLNRLLASMQTDNDTLTASTNMARPGEANKKRKDAARQEASSKDVFAAARRVAALMGEGEEQKKQTESELLAKLLSQRQGAVDSTSGDESTKGAQAETKVQENELSLSDLIVGMKIDRRQQPAEQTRGDFVRRALAATKSSSGQQQRYPRQDGSSRGDRRSSIGAKERKREAETYTGSVNLFGSEPLGIFKELAQLRDSADMLRTWAHLQQRELQFQIAHPPGNYFEKLAAWTEQGKVWRFPIDNEQDMNEEAAVDFSEHIFLEQHLEPWCPARGPIRHFMELVCVGLSKNPYITAREKREHINWYRDYFEKKKDMLKELMQQTAQQPKQMDA